jgi:hypothetical protein
LEDFDDTYRFLSRWEVATRQEKDETLVNSLNAQEKGSILRRRAISPEKLPKLKCFSNNFSNNLRSGFQNLRISPRKLFRKQIKNLSVDRQNSTSPLYRMNSSLKSEKPSIITSPILYFLPKITVSKAKLISRC